jgi:hypothetical protein
MQYKITISVIVLLVAAMILAGCTGTQGTPGASTAGSSAVSSAAGSNLVTSPTDAMPDNNAVSVTVQQKVYDKTIPVVFDGGKGQNLVKSIDVTLYRADGQVTTATIGSDKGDEAILMGTNQTDRVIVYVTEVNGQTYKVADVLSAYLTHG